MCKCLEHRQQALEKNKDYIDPKLETIVIVDLGTGILTEKAGKLVFTYKTKKKNGEISKKIEKSFFNFSHCPFCGEAYE